MLKATLLSQAKEWKLLQEDAFHSSRPVHDTNVIVNAASLQIDLSHNRLSPRILSLLENLCETQSVMDFFEAMLAGKEVNVSENQKALHVALRDPHFSIQTIREDIQTSLRQMETLTDLIYRGNFFHNNAKTIKHIVHMGIGGSHQGPEALIKALENFKTLAVDFHFISNIDPHELSMVLNKISLENTLFIVSSKSFITDETLTNFYTLCKMLKVDEDFIQSHCIAITANKAKALSLGFKEEYILSMPPYVGGRFSLWGVIGFSLMLAVGKEHFHGLLQGAHAMDRVCMSRDFSKNPALMLAALDCWYRNFLKAPSRALLIYSSAMKSLLPYFQQLMMESNGKSKNLHGIPLDYETSPIIWGGIGTNSQHSFQQLLMDSSQLIPMDIILPLNHSAEFSFQQEKFVNHCHAQRKAFYSGRNGLGQPNNFITFEKITPYTLGALIALYEHRTVMSAALWGINPFDQPGVELSKKLLSESIIA